MSAPISLRDLSPVHWMGIAVLAGIAALLIFGERDSERRQKRDLDALAACRMAIKAAASSTSTVPFAPPRTVNGGLQFLWREGSGLRVPNAAGVLTDAWASCEVRNGAVVDLVVNGEAVLP